ncbi:hypothetical protein OIU77_019303 [Salix suchowensis]|uniref:Uncharacterized protein n=1 Tax=Salix suchowensis TaxID=1278906 RepID=A0ABQ9CFI2_9ROSI|nr:hypothetical protein OIU77_019303 [Salix suchowensis]
MVNEAYFNSCSVEASNKQNNHYAKNGELYRVSTRKHPHTHPPSASSSCPSSLHLFFSSPSQSPHAKPTHTGGSVGCGLRLCSHNGCGRSKTRKHECAPAEQWVDEDDGDGDEGGVDGDDDDVMVELKLNQKMA